MSIKAIALDGRTVKSIYEGSTRLFPPYEELEYVQTDTNCLFDTGKTINFRNDTFELKCQVPSLPKGNTGVFGCRDSAEDASQNVAEWFTWPANDALKFRTDWGGFDGKQVSSALNTDLLIKCCYKTIWLNDYTYTKTSKAELMPDQESKYTFLLGDMHNGANLGYASYHTPLKIYYAKLTDKDGNLKVDVVPCRYNGEYGLWDRVAWKFISKTGTGTVTGK